MAEGSSSSSSGDLGNRPMKRARGVGGSEARPQPLLTISGVDSPRTCGPGIASLWREGIVTDCIVVVEGREFAAHRVVLAAASPFMKAAFASGMQESISARVTLRDMRAAVFEAVVTFMYENATSVPEADIAEVLQAARLLQEQELTNATLNLLIARLSPASCIETWRMGDVMSLPSLAHRAKLFALKHLSEVSAQDSFATLPAAWLHELLRSDELAVAGEQVVYHALQQWYGLQQPSAVAMSDLDLLLRTVRWALLPQETAKEANGDPMVRASADGMAIVAVSFQDALFGRPPKLRKSAAQINQDAMDERLGRRVFHNARLPKSMADQVPADWTARQYWYEKLEKRVWVFAHPIHGEYKSIAMMTLKICQLELVALGNDMALDMALTTR